MKQSIPFTREGLLNFNKEYTELQEKRKDAVLELKTAREMGDLSENAAYKVARAKLSSTDRRLRNLDAILSKAVVVTPKSQNVVDIGSRVTVKTPDGLKIYTIVGSHESDFKLGKISDYSPIGRALIGKSVNNKVRVKTPQGEAFYTIKNIQTE